LGPAVRDRKKKGDGMAASEGVRRGFLRGRPSKTGRLGAFFRSPAALLFLNLLDGLFTLFFLQMQVAEEANPLMRLAYKHSPLSFMVLKLAVVNAGVALLWAHRDSKAARTAMAVGVGLYGLIVAYHLSFLFALLTGSTVG